MTKRIFRAICLTAIAVFLATLLMIFDVLYSYFTNVQQSRLRAETAMAATATEHAGMDFLTDLDADGYRITWIAADGSVLFDSASDPGSMENHLERAEIRQALSDGYGESARYSTTLLERSLYCAGRLKDGTVLRLSVTHGSVLLLLLGMLQPILVIVSIAAAISFVMAKGLSKRIMEPLDRLDPEAAPPEDSYPELMPLLRRLHGQQLALRERSETLRQKQDELDTIIGSMREGILLADADRRIILVNRAARELLRQPELLQGDPLPELPAPELEQALCEGLQGRLFEGRAELSEHVLQLSAAPIQRGSDSVCAAIVLFDITQRERAEQQRREFTANVSHELKTPLHAISGYSELLKCGMVRPEDISGFAGSIYSEAQRLIALVEDIIELSHLDEGGTDLQWEPLDLYAIAEEVRSALSALAEQNSVIISLTGSSTGIYGVYEPVRTILYDLCDNAIKYDLPGGTVTITVSDKCVRIADTGIGIPPEHLDRIFERFYRVDKSRSKAVGGTGLGLSIVKHAAVILGATLEVESTVGTGTTVTVHFR